MAHFRMMAGYNRTANRRLYESCAGLSDDDYRKPRSGSFGSIHALLNHLLLGDRIWMARFEGGGRTTPQLNTVLHDDFAELRTAREAEDARIVAFFDALTQTFFDLPIQYANNQGRACVEQPGVALAHFFNHQTHHRGQIHVMLSQTPVEPPSLDLHRIVNPL
jgi:uncharacterized damage-inducible protein DinB